MRSRKRNSVLWKITREGSQQINYLMGTMHLKNHQAYTYVPLAKEYIRNVDQYAGEMNLADAAKADLHQYFQLPEESLLSDFFSKKQYQKLSKVVTAVTGYDISHLERLTPMAISNIISESWIQDDYGMAVDHHLWQFAEGLDKHMDGLESVDDQIQILQRVPPHTMLVGLKRIMTNVTKHRKMILTLGESYAAGRIHVIYRKSKKSLGAIKKIMLYDRNQRMVDKFQELSLNGSLFASVGAAHLSGTKGMLHLLHHQGFIIEPIYQDA